MSWVLDLGAIIGGIAAVLSAVWSRKARDAATTAASDAQTAASQTNGPIRAQGEALASQGVILGMIRDGISSLGHQMGEVRADLGRLDVRVTTDIQELRADYAAQRTAARSRSDDTPA